MLMDELPATDHKREDLAQMLAAAHRAAALTRQLLAFSRRQMLQPKILQLNDVVTDVERMLRRIIGEDVELTTSLSQDLAQIRADSGQIEQIVLNLTVNARDAMPEGGKILIETSNVELDSDYASRNPSARPGSFVLLNVTDTGIGMDEETQKRIFEPFFTTKEVGKGTGLGLSTVYGIVQQCGAHVRVESKLSHGTSFKIYFPKVESKPEATNKTVPPVHTSGEHATILLVEDDDAVRQVAARILRSSGYSVIEARRPSEARRLAEVHAASLDLLLSDVVLPEMNGASLANELCAQNPRLRVLLMSGYPGTAAVPPGAFDFTAPYVEKPFTPRALSERVAEVLKEPFKS
jgi:CheY-like chemotaxis protein